MSRTMLLQWDWLLPHGEYKFIATKYQNNIISVFFVLTGIEPPRGTNMRLLSATYVNGHTHHNFVTI